MLKQSHAEEVPPEEPEYECDACGDEITEHSKCFHCGKTIELDGFYCDDGTHYCWSCAEKLMEIEKAEKEEKAKIAEIPGQLDMFPKEVDECCETCADELTNKYCCGCVTNNGVTKERKLHWRSKE